MPDVRHRNKNQESQLAGKTDHIGGKAGGHGFNPAMMVTARQLKGWNQADLATITGRSQAFISKVERDVLTPSREFVEALAATTEFPTTFFHQPGHMGGLPVSVHPMFRKQHMAEAKQTSKVKVLDRVNAEMSLRIFHSRMIGDRLDDQVNKFAELHSEINTCDPEGAARAFRHLHGVPKGPIHNLTMLAENSGILVFHCDFGNDTDEMVDGVSMHVPSLPPAIFLNKNKPADRQRFSLAHEIGHVFLHRIPTETMELEANDFAGELLLPEADMRRVFSPPVTLHKLAAMKPEWRVSVQALLYRAGKLRLIGDEVRGSLWREINRMGWRKHEPPFLDFEPERATLVATILGGIGNELPEVLHTFSNKLKEMYQIDE